LTDFHKIGMGIIKVTGAYTNSVTFKIKCRKRALTKLKATMRNELVNAVQGNK